jgi:hypothetical protein
MSRLSALAYLNDSPIHGLTDIPLRLLPTDIGCVRDSYYKRKVVKLGQEGAVLKIIKIDLTLEPIDDEEGALL